MSNETISPTDMTFKVISPSLGRRRTIWRYFRIVVVASLFGAMIFNKGSSVSQRTLFQRYDVPVEGYVVSIIVCVFLLLYGLVRAFRDDFKIGEVSLTEEGIGLLKGKNLESFKYSQINGIQVELCYTNSVTGEGGQHWKISFSVDGRKEELDVVVPKDELDGLIAWRNLHSELVT